MKRNTTVYVLAAMLLLADALALEHTLLGNQGTLFDGAAVTAEAAAALLITTLSLLIFSKNYRRQKKPVSRARFEIVQPLRRLFVSVWS